MNSPKGLEERRRKMEAQKRKEAVKSIDDYLTLGIVEHVGTEEGTPVFAFTKSN
tara:strand:- start:211 stop:372 length:162 start_codon:yes stop_codon:yes gene_type:complete